MKNRFLVCKSKFIARPNGIYDRQEHKFHSVYKTREMARFHCKRLNVQARRASMHIATEGFRFSRPVVRNFKLVEGIAS